LSIWWFDFLCLLNFLFIDLLNITGLAFFENLCLSSADFCHEVLAKILIIQIIPACNPGHLLRLANLMSHWSLLRMRVIGLRGHIEILLSLWV